MFSFSLIQKFVVLLSYNTHWTCYDLLTVYLRIIKVVRSLFRRSITLEKYRLIFQMHTSTVHSLRINGFRSLHSTVLLHMYAGSNFLFIYSPSFSHLLSQSSQKFYCLRHPLKEVPKYILLRYVNSFLI